MLHTYDSFPVKNVSAQLFELGTVPQTDVAKLFMGHAQQAVDDSDYIRIQWPKNILTFCFYLPHGVRSWPDIIFFGVTTISHTAAVRGSYV